jgi:anti-sigma B factor antagonist
MMAGPRQGQCHLIFGSPPQRFGACRVHPAESVPERFSCKSHEVTDGVTRVWLGGEIGRPDAQALDDELRAAQAVAAIVILDVRAVVAIDATVVHLIRAADRRTADGQRLVILRGSGAIDADLDALGLDARMLTIEEPPPLRSVDASDSFEVVTEVDADRAVITVRGAIDLATGPRLGAALAIRGRPLLLDLRGVGFMDATGIRLLLEAGARAGADGVDLELIPSAAVERTLELVSLREQFNCMTPQTRLAG